MSRALAAAATAAEPGAGGGVVSRAAGNVDCGTTCCPDGVGAKAANWGGRSDSHI